MTTSAGDVTGITQAANYIQQAVDTFTAIQKAVVNIRDSSVPVHQGQGADAMRLQLDAWAAKLSGGINSYTAAQLQMTSDATQYAAHIAQDHQNATKLLSLLNGV